jgi:hypothetical protein
MAWSCSVLRVLAENQGQPERRNANTINAVIFVMVAPQ